MATLQENRDGFRATVQEMVGHTTFAHQKYTNGSYKIAKNLREFICESAFLKIYIGWELFVENCFVDYLLNEPSILNRRPAKWVYPIDREHAHRIIIGTQKFMDWSNPELVRRMSGYYFHDGYVFNSALSSINLDLSDLRAIRNCAAHSSVTVHGKLDGISSRILGTPCNNFTAYKLLYSQDPRSTTSQTVFDRYLELLDIAADEIANG